MQRRNFLRTSVGSIACLASVNTFSHVLNASDTIFETADSDSSPLKTSFNKLTRHTAIVKCNGKDVKIHAIQTGSVAVKESHFTNHTFHFLTPIKITVDKHFTEFLPVWVWVIEHPEGVVVIDTGENARVMHPDYFKIAGKLVSSYTRKNIKFHITPEDEIGNQLTQLSIASEDIKCVVLTHLHLDHTDGLHDFKGTEIIVSQREFDQPSGSIPQLYPAWFNPNRVAYKKDLVNVFHEAYPLTRKEDLLLIPTNGHTLHHASVLFKTDNFDILFAGDVSYTQQQLLENDLPGINADYRKTLATYENIRKYAQDTKLIYLPSHDAHAAQRLTQQAFLW